MLTSKLKLIALIVGLAVILCCAWLKPLDSLATQRVDEGFKRAAISFGTARAISAVISLVQDVNISGNVVFAGVEFSPGEVLHPIRDLTDKFADLMLAATVIFGAMKLLIVIGGSTLSSLAVTSATLGWSWFSWRGHPSPIWLSKLAVILILIRFAVPITMLGSDAVYKTFMANEYTASQAVLDGNAKPDGSMAPPAPNVLAAKIAAISQGAKQFVDHMISVIVVFLLQTLVIPLLLFWALFRVLSAIFQKPVYRGTHQTENGPVLEVRS